MNKWILSVVLVGLVGCAPTPPAPIEDASVKPNDLPPAEELAVAPKALPQKDSVRLRIEEAVAHVRRRDLYLDSAFWTIFHGILGLGPNVTLKNRETGDKVNALDYICDGGEIRGLEFKPTKWGLDVTLGEFLPGGQGVGQGHQDQFIAEMGQWGMPADRKFVVFGKDYTFMDFVRHSQMRASTTRKQELSWAIVVVGQYLGTDVKPWTNSFGEKLRFEDMIRYELDASVEQAACGGTHRLFGLTWAYHLHLKNGGRTEGVWQEVADKTAKYRDLAKKYRGADGSFSTDFFNGPANAADKTRRINTTGHTLEWLALALPKEELRQPWLQEAASALSMMILDLRDDPIESGSLYHAAHGLLLYYARVYDRETLGPPELLYPLPPGWE